MKNEDCFILKLETSSDILRAQSTTNTEIVHHTIWGYFSQRTGLLIQFEDTKLIRMKATKGAESVFHETSMKSVLDDCSFGFNYLSELWTNRIAKRALILILDFDFIRIHLHLRVAFIWLYQCPHRSLV
ncbi:unnamed protein product [Fraxinus pennsylvanica]|uniref:Uncharacterized protein n=1 Tax=Fraxinus pennsylvanica TaxID=56036 RepID=A0AAD1YUY9_9LAMI|nr:unnamed protein product [Fraxinus pennsylvanica]